eukprot:389349-Rhodomonas_salina.1
MRARRVGRLIVSGAQIESRSELLTLLDLSCMGPLSQFIALLDTVHLPLSLRIPIRQPRIPLRAQMTAR